jgi:2-keto-3-deoxy-L-rhamnonate aldolase
MRPSMALEMRPSMVLEMRPSMALQMSPSESIVGSAKIGTNSAFLVAPSRGLNKAWPAEVELIQVFRYHYPAVSNNVALTPTTMQRLAAHPKIVGCKLSHGNLDDYALIGLNPNIEHARFHVYTGLGQQLLGVLNVGGAGAIDGMAAFFPRAVVRLYDLFTTREQAIASGARPPSAAVSSVDAAALGMAMRELQYKVCRGEKLVVRWGTIGIREAVARVRGLGESDGGRWPLRGGFPAGDAEWEVWKDAIDDLQHVEQALEQ